MTILYLIRHGITEYNVLGKYQGISDNSLNEIGINQSKNLVHYFNHIHLDKIYVSKLRRTFETAQYFAGVKSIQPEILNDIEELNGGFFEGKEDSELIERYAEEVHNLRTNLPAFKAPNGETAKQVYNRVSKAIVAIVNQNKGKTIAIVSHGIVLQLFISYILKIPFDDIKAIKLENASVSKINVDDTTGEMSIEFMNDYKHLYL